MNLDIFEKTFSVQIVEKIVDNYIELDFEAGIYIIIIR